MPVPLDELGEALDQSAGIESFIDVTNGALWPAQLFDVEQGPVDFDPGSDRWLLVVGLGSQPASRDDATFRRHDPATGPRVTSHRRAWRVWRISTVPHRTPRAGRPTRWRRVPRRRSPGSSACLARRSRLPIRTSAVTPDLTDPTTRIVPDRPFKREARRCCGASNSSHLRCLPPLTRTRLVQRRRRRLHLHRMPSQRQATHRDPRQHLGRDRRTERLKPPDGQASGSLIDGPGTVIS